MLTRYKKKLMDKMADNTNNTEVSDVFDINNQLGANEELEGANSEPKGVRGQSPTLSQEDIHSLISMMKTQQESIKNLEESINNKFKKQEESIKKQFESINNRLEKQEEALINKFNTLQHQQEILQESNQKQFEAINNKIETIQQTQQEMIKKHEESIKTLQHTQKETNKQIETDRHKHEETHGRMEAIFNREIADVRQEVAERTNKIDKLTQQQEESKVDTQKNTKKIETVDKECKIITERVSNLEIKLTENTNRITSVEEEKEKRIEEIANTLSTVKRHIENGNNRNNCNIIEKIKEITYNGYDVFPMEFLKELDEVQRTYYQNTENVQWIHHHLTGEAVIWWRLVKNQIRTYAEFRELFTETFGASNYKEALEINLSTENTVIMKELP